jgi:probable F420-dependent oxidoreductase
MALKDRIPLGMSLPHRSPDPIDAAAVVSVARRAEALGFRDLWVTENTLDHVHCFDPISVLSFAAAATSRIRLGASVVVLAVHSPMMVAHQWATLDHLSGGRAVLGVGLGREHHYREFEVPEDGKVARFREEVAIIKSLWTQPKTDFDGRFYHLSGATMSPKGVQKPHIPLWMGVGHPNAIRRAASLADGWMGSGGSSIAEFGASVPILKEALAEAGRDPEAFPISKRVFMAVDDDPAVARRELDRWFVEVYRNPRGAEESGVYGTPAQVAEKLGRLVDMGANHLLLNPVSRHAEQLEAVAALAGLG